MNKTLSGSLFLYFCGFSFGTIAATLFGLINPYVPFLLALGPLVLSLFYFWLEKRK